MKRVMCVDDSITEDGDIPPFKFGDIVHAVPANFCCSGLAGVFIDEDSGVHNFQCSICKRRRIGKIRWKQDRFIDIDEYADLISDEIKQPEHAH